ncbi:MAG: VOC family protein [Lapillicoccus sp.]
MVFWQLTIDANDPPRLARFGAHALGYQFAPPTEPQTTWWAHYQARLEGESEFDDRLEIVEGKVAELTEHGATVLNRSRSDDPDDIAYFVVLQDPEGNEFCIS